MSTDSIKESDLCIFHNDSECLNCSLKNILECHFSLKKLMKFVLSFFLIITLIFLGLILNGFFLEFMVFIIVFISYALFFFEFWEIRILCSHCPFYAEQRSTIRCFGNYGSIKIWKYRPEPMSKSEKLQLIIGFLILFTIITTPLLFLAFNLQYIWSLLIGIGLIIFIANLKKNHCRKCFNFSCPFNTCSREIIDEFLNRNPIMRDAWLRTGWKTVS